MPFLKKLCTEYCIGEEIVLENNVIFSSDGKRLITDAGNQFLVYESQSGTWQTLGSGIPKQMVLTETVTNVLPGGILQDKDVSVTWKGHKATISGDGTKVLIPYTSARRQDNGEYIHKYDRVFLYEWNGSSWNNILNLPVYFEQDNSSYGLGGSLVISEDGLTFAIGGNAPSPYKTRIYSFNYDGWWRTHTGSNIGSHLEWLLDRSTYTLFGNRMSLSSDGRRLISLNQGGVGSSSDEIGYRTYEIKSGNYNFSSPTKFGKTTLSDLGVSAPLQNMKLSGDGSKIVGNFGASGIYALVLKNWGETNVDSQDYIEVPSSENTFDISDDATKVFTFSSSGGYISYYTLNQEGWYLAGRSESIEYDEGVRNLHLSRDDKRLMLVTKIGSQFKVQAFEIIQ